jgi:hypothetical protein
VVYDLATTAVLTAKGHHGAHPQWKHQMASSKGPSEIRRTHAGDTPSRIRRMLDRIAEAISSMSVEVRAYVREHTHFMEIGDRMLKEWEKELNCQ